MIYLLLSALFLCLGLVRERGLFPFLVLISCLPFSNSFSSYFYQLGLYSYDYFFFGLLISSVVSKCLATEKTFSISKWAFLASLIIFTYSIAAIFSKIPIDVYFLRDLRPAIFAVEIIATALLLKSQKIQLSNIKVLNLVILAGATNLLWLTLSIFGVMSSEDQYYTTNNFKYFDASTYISALYIMYFFSKSNKSKRLDSTLAPKRKQILAVSISLISIIFSGYRILALATILATTIAAAKSPKKIILIVFVFLISAISFIWIANYFGAARVAESLTIEGLFQQLTVRYEPALNVIYSFSPINYVLGNGFGTVFDITWFEYRSLDTQNNFVDSAYITFYAKYGVLGILYLASITLALVSIAPKVMRRSLAAYLLILFIAYAISYQPASAGIIVGCIMTRILQSNSENVIKNDEY